MSKDDKPARGDDPDRREALKALARFAVYVTPAMTVLVKGAEAHHRPGHCRAGPPGDSLCFSPA